MAFRRPRRFARRGRPSGRSRTLAWKSFVIDNAPVTTGVPFSATFADSGDLGRTTGFERHMATLLRIRGNLSLVPDSVGAGATAAWMGISLRNIDDVGQQPSGFAFGDDEDVLDWQSGVFLSNATEIDTITWLVDVKAKRVLETEDELRVDVNVTGANSGRVFGHLRALFALG